MSRFIYEGTKTKEISFPLGGIGTGCIGLAGNGRLIDWEIFNRPNKQSENGFSFFAVKAEADGELLDARVLNGDLLPSYTGNIQTRKHGGYGFGPNQATMAGVPHFQHTRFIGEFPFARLQAADDCFPGTVELTAFNPFIPLNDKDSSIPGAFFDIALHNTTDRTITYTVNLSLTNPMQDHKRYHRYARNGKIQLIKLSSRGPDFSAPEFGDLSIATDAEDVSYQEYWYRGGWFDNLEMFWRDFTEAAKFTNRTYDPAATKGNGGDVCSLAAHFLLQPGEKNNVRFVITWSFPNCHNYWHPESCCCSDDDCKPSQPATWKNYYATLFSDSTKSAAYALEHWERLYDETKLFKDALYSSSLPPAALDAVSANISILKSPTCLRLPDGSFYGFEGCICNEGCCEGSCTHVWNYAYALPFLFPKLERSMRDLDFKYNIREDGKMAFRLQLPLGRSTSDFRACADGQFGGVIKAYREWKISGDTAWLKSIWPAVKKSIEFAWADTNEDRWDADRDGVLEGRQHHTLDMELYGPNAWLNGFYLTALKAGAEMARHLGEADTAEQYLALFSKGKTWTDEHLFNGHYYVQTVDLKDRSVLEKYDESAVRDYWNNEAKEIKYQVADGCVIDQVLAQWHANLCGLGEIFDPEQTRKSLASIYRHNFKKSMRNVFNPWRLYSLNDEAGLMICTWPEGTVKPTVPLTYSTETMNGFEYQAAIHMIQEGMVVEGMEIVEAIRDRYDGERRNPWNEFECGSNYARSMASYALLLAFSGFEYDMTEKRIGFQPITGEEYFSCFWSLDSGWGTFVRKNGWIELNVLYGELELRCLNLPFLKGQNVNGISLDGTEVLDCNWHEEVFFFSSTVRINAGHSLVIKHGAPPPA